jgi:methanogenic corrinoid protein MtbC1
LQELELHRRLAEAVVGMKPELVKSLAIQAIAEGYPAETAIEKGLAAGMNEVGRLFSAKEYFVPEVLVCAKAMYAGFDILKEKVVKEKLLNKGTIVIGVVEGDFHDIGKNIVKLMLEAAGFRMVDLGKNVSIDSFSLAVEIQKPAIVALSTLMTTTMDKMGEITSQLTGNWDKLMIMVGGAPVQSDFARSIGAHFYGQDAHQAVIGAHKLLGLNFEA